METEQIKMLIEALSQLGQNAKEGFVWWLVIDKIIPVVAWLSIAVLLYRLILRALHVALLYDDIKRLTEEIKGRSYISYSYERQDIKRFLEEVKQTMKEKGKNEDNTRKD